ncbi:Vesicle transport protein [Aphelenchoides bicaudatus]|nr:Vesicle transport protein [Aphelenchoides bicaudatus]
MKMFDRFRRQQQGDPEGEQSVEGDSSRLTDLSFELRLYCFGGCLVLSMLTSILGSPFVSFKNNLCFMFIGYLLKVFAGKFAEFAVMTSLGAIISLVGTFFLSSPIGQLKKMFEPTRIVCTLIYLLSITLALISGLVLKNPVLAIICIVVEYAAMIWYSLSYIPFARETIWSFVGKCC